MRKRSSSKDCLPLGSEPPIQPDPISRYNYVIEHYNDSINIKHGILLKKAYIDQVYKFWYNSLRHFYILLFLLYLSPYITFISLTLTLYTFIIHENALAIYRKNLKKNGDIFQNIVISDQVCLKANTHNLYFDISQNNLWSFPLPVNTLSVLKQREIEGKIRFMVCDLEFVQWSEGLRRPRILILAHLVFNLLLFLGMQIFVYDPYLCFNLLHPIQSIGDCERFFS